MIVGFSLSPGGLLLPYHLGALASLTYHGHITPSTPLAGASAGAIAVTSHATGVPPFKALDASIRISQRCNPLFVARGQILPSLFSEMDSLLDDNAHEIVNEREGMVGLAHRELFPENKPILKTHFDTRDCLMDAVCDSSMFPYFTSNQPFRTVKRRGDVLPRVVVDGCFSVPIQRIGCPDFSHAVVNENNKNGNGNDMVVTKTGGDEAKKAPAKVDRTITISCFPEELLTLASKKHDRIGPKFEKNIAFQAFKTAKMATQASRPKELIKLFEQGWADSERWSFEEERRNRGSTRKVRRERYEVALKRKFLMQC